MAKVICELSGGADSVLATILAQERWKNNEIIGVFVNYSQVCSCSELQCATKIANKLGIKLKIIDLLNIWKGGMITGETKGDKNVYTPLRNVAILGVVMSYTESIGGSIIVTGSKGLCKLPEDDYSYYDSSLPFYKLMESVWYYTTENKRVVRICPILAEGRKNKMTKKEVYSKLLEYGIGFKDTWSCFKGEVSECGECHNCRNKIKIFKELKCDYI